MTIPPYAAAFDFSCAAFRFCPSCAADGLVFRAPNHYRCPSCSFEFFMNTAAACGAFLALPDRRILLLRRNQEPAIGTLDLPGGFIDPGEPAEHAVEREIREETGLAARNIRFLCSAPNRYEYRGVPYPTCDLFFIGDLDSGDETAVRLQKSEVAEAVFLPGREIRLEDIAFPSTRLAFERYLSLSDRAGTHSASP